MKKFTIFLLLVVVAIGILGGVHLTQDVIARMDGREPGMVYVEAAGTPDAEVLQDVDRAAAFFPQFMADRFQVKVQRPLDIVVAADRNTYEELLVKRMEVSPDTVKEKAQYTSGQSSGNKGLCIINGDKNSLKKNNNRYSTTAHELFHQMQHEMSRGKSGYENSFYWLEEGSADYVGALVSEALGAGSVEKWYMDARFALQYAKNPAGVDQLQHTTEEERLKMLSTQAKSYDLSDVMTYYLLQHYGAGQPEEKIAEFYQHIASEKAEDAFAKTFGVELSAFLQEFSHWWQAECSRPAQFQVIVRDNVDKSAVNQFMQQVELSRTWLKRNGGGELKGDYQLVFVSGPEDFAAAEMEYGYISEVEARRIAAGSVWAENNSMLFINTPQIADKVQSIFVSTAMLNRLYMTQRLASEEGLDMAWLIRGASYAAGVARLGENGHGDIVAYQRAWRKKLREGQPLPTLDKLSTNKALQEAGRNDGENLSHLCEYAVAELVHRYGWRSVFAWLSAARQSGDGRQSFSRVFGLTVTDFAAQIHMMIY